MEEPPGREVVVEGGGPPGRSSVPGMEEPPGTEVADRGGTVEGGGPTGRSHRGGGPVVKESLGRSMGS